MNVSICNGSSLVRTVTNYGIQYGQLNSLYLAITSYCVHNYITVALKTLLIIFTLKLVEGYQLQTASFVRELVLIRESTLEL